MSTNGQRIVVFGAAGWVGRAILANLEGRHQVRAVDCGPEAWAACEDVDGQWDGEQIVSEHWVRESIRTHSDELGYGYFWWLDSHQIDDHSYDSLLAWGYGGQHIFVVRELDLVVVFTGANIETDVPPWRMLEKYILPAVQQGG